MEHPRADVGSFRVFAGLFALSTTVLTLEILQTKIFAFTLDAVTIYLAIGICMLGLGAAATLLSMLPQVPAGAVRRVAAAAATFGAVGIVIAHVVFARLSYDVSSPGWAALPSLVALTLPYLGLGVAITLLLTANAAAIGRAYAINLAGSALGCLLVFALLDGLGGDRALLAVTGLGLAGALLVSRMRMPAVLAAGAVAAVVLVIAGTRVSALFPFMPEVHGQVALMFRKAAELRRQHPGERIEFTSVFSRWDRTARVDVYRFETSLPELQSRGDGQPIDTLLIAQDASAGSFLIGVGDDTGRARSLFERTVYAAGYVAEPVRDALIIGLGGAPDILTALHHGVRHIDAVDINGTTIDIVRQEFAEFLGHPYERPEVTLHRMDGRTFVRETHQTYDLIQLSGVDTKALFASGSLAVNENYMYTREAMVDMLERLRPDGVLSIARFLGEPERITSIAVAGLRALGVDAPNQHLFSIQQGFLTCVLIKRSPFTPEEIEKLHAWAGAVAEPPDVVIPMLEWVLVTFRQPIKILYSPPPRPVQASPYFEALAEGRHDAFLAAAKDDLSSPVDDRPFFFFKVRPADAITAPPDFLLKLYRFIAQILVVSAVLILLPLFVVRWRGLGVPQAGRTMVYFACLGAGFMLIEIGMIQHFVLLLGHQTYAVTVVLAGLLVSAGVGSLLSARFDLASPRPLRAAIGVLVAVLVVYAFGLRMLFDAASAPFAVRLVLALSVLAVPGVLLGLPFPFGLRRLNTTNPSLVPWGVGVNAFASVLGSTVAVLLAMLTGLRVVLLLGAVLYVIAILSLPTAQQAPVSGGEV